MPRGGLRETSWTKPVYYEIGRRAELRKPSARDVSVSIESLESRMLLNAGDIDTTFGNNGAVLLPPGGYVAKARLGKVMERSSLSAPRPIPRYPAKRQNSLLNG